MPYLSPYIALYQRFIPIKLFLSEPNNQEIKQTEFDHAGTSIINISFNKKIGWEIDGENNIFLGFTRTTIEKNINTRITSYSRSLQSTDMMIAQRRTLGFTEASCINIFHYHL